MTRICLTCPRRFQSVYRRCFEHLDLVQVCLIMIEDSSVRNPTNGPLYMSCRSEMKEHADLALAINNLLGVIKRLGKTRWKWMDFEGIERDRLAFYGKTHPVSLIYPYLNLNKVHTYITGFPGLHTKDIGERSVASTFHHSEVNPPPIIRSSSVTISFVHQLYYLSLVSSNAMYISLTSISNLFFILEALHHERLLTNVFLTTVWCQKAIAANANRKISFELFPRQAM